MSTRSISANTPIQVNHKNIGVEVKPNAVSILVNFHYNNITSVSQVNNHALLSSAENNAYQYTGESVTVSGTTYYELEAHDSGVTPANLWILSTTPQANDVLYDVNEEFMDEFGNIDAVTAGSPYKITLSSIDYSATGQTKVVDTVTYYEFESSDSVKIYAESDSPAVGDTAYTYVAATVTSVSTVGAPFSVSGTGWQTDTDKVTITNEYPFSGNYVLDGESTGYKIGLITSNVAVVNEETLAKNAVSSWEGHYQWDNNTVRVWSDEENVHAGDELYFSSDHPSYNKQTVASTTPGSVNCTVYTSVTGDTWTANSTVFTDSVNTICNIPYWMMLKFSQDVVITEK